MEVCSLKWPGISNQTLLSTAEFEESIRKLKFLAYGIVGSFVIILGIVGNILNLIVLTRPSLQGVTFTYLTWLAISDLMTLLISTTSFLRLQGAQSYSYIAAVYFSYVELPLVNACMAISVFLVVSVTVDRYFSVCLPTRFKEVHNRQRARRAVLAAYVAAFIIYIPICFQKSPVEVFDGSNHTMYIACEDHTVVNHTIFKVYLLFKELAVRLGPVVALAMLNAAIIMTFHRTSRIRRTLLTANHLKVNRKVHEERRLIILLAGIVILFFVCMTPAAVLTLLHSEDKDMNYDFQLFRAIANVLELANFAMNFYVYCLCSPEIRKTFVTTFCGIQTLTSGECRPTPDVTTV